jgi:hypothetical protein
LSKSEGRGLVIVIVVVLAALVGSQGCSGSHSDAASSSPGTRDSGADGAGAARDLNASPGSLGGDCQADSDCAQGLRCLSPPAYPNAAKFCASPCSTKADCAAFAATSYAIQVPLDPDGIGNNAWGTTVLARGYECAQSPALGGTQKYCQFFCAANEAVNSDFTSCACLPRYKWITDSSGHKLRCDWDDQSVCSIVSYPGRRNVCDACNSAPLLAGCYTGDYVCALNRSFNGTCLQGFSGNALNACLASTTSDCDPACQESCGTSGDSVGLATLDSCTNLCCKPGGRSASVPPTCAAGTGDAGTSGDAATSGDAGCTPDRLACGTDAAGVETPCAAGSVCCYTLGPGSSMTCGAVSACASPLAASGASDQCPAGQLQLCKTDQECGGGYHCSGPASGYCVSGASATDAGSADSGACVDIASAPPAVAAIATSGAAPTPTGGTVVDGTYQATAVKVYGTMAVAGTQTGTFGGVYKVTAPSIESVYAGSNVSSFYGSGTFSVSGGTVNVTYSCSSTGPGSTSFGYTVTSATTLDITTQGTGYTSVATFTKM